LKPAKKLLQSGFYYKHESKIRAKKAGSIYLSNMEFGKVKKENPPGRLAKMGAPYSMRIKMGRWRTDDPRAQETK
jgi:hypothetical protein